MRILRHKDCTQAICTFFLIRSSEILNLLQKFWQQDRVKRLHLLFCTFLKYYINIYLNIFIPFFIMKLILNCLSIRISRTERSGRYGSDQPRDELDWRDRRDRDQERDHNMRRWGDERRGDRYDGERRGSRDSPEVFLIFNKLGVVTLP